VNTPQLRWKESDRAKELVEAAHALGAKATLALDGFSLDARDWKVPLEPCRLNTAQDHRLAMAFGLLEFFYPTIQPSERESVAKSFAVFWSLLGECRDLVL